MSNLAKLILASKSPRRIELLKMLNLDFTVMPSAIDESKFNYKNPQELVLRLAYEKAFDIHTQVEPNKIIIGADTIVYIDQLILGKPKNEANVISMLSRLSNRWHEVISGIAIITTDNFGELVTIQDYEITKVHFRKLNNTEIESYAKIAEPYDKAGAYALQGLGGCFVDKIEGCYANVIGLPLAKMVSLLRQTGVKILDYCS